jgi:EAL domain-containing protein (putative c-di-GMP-specific phosphodiesterase class I)/GGDEF domain-containing protein
LRNYRRLFRGGSQQKVPTVSQAIGSIRQPIQDRKELLVIYFNFDRYTKIEEIYGWEKLDEVLETTARAIREFIADTPFSQGKVTVNFDNDDDFVLFLVPRMEDAVPNADVITEMTAKLHQHLSRRIEDEHGEDIASLFDTFVGHQHLHYDPKIRLERQIYRAVRDAANSSNSIEQREFGRKAADLRETLRTGGLYIDYHPIVVTETEKIFGYEALARGTMRSMRRPEVMFEIAGQTDMIWELSRLCRNTAISGMKKRLEKDQLLFINIDPHDFTDPAFTQQDMDVPDPSRVVLEITERTAIRDYPKFRGRLKEFRDSGYRFAVDDAGSGYAGLGSIANLEPDFIKLDISLINCIDVNFIKQSLVEQMVAFANKHQAMVIAEGVETAEEYETVKQLGVHLVQGFYLHPPTSPASDGERSIPTPVPPPPATPATEKTAPKPKRKSPR